MSRIALYTSIIILTFGVSSCKDKCEICTKDSEPEVRICEEDYNSNTEYGLALDLRIASGYNCR
jgi:hypothetical protein